MFTTEARRKTKAIAKFEGTEVTEHTERGILRGG